jgi:hypothetical protein
MLRHLHRSRTGSARRFSGHKVRPLLEPLEGRIALSATPLGPSFDIVDDVSPNPPFDAKDPVSGRSVVAWAASGDVFFQLYNADGSPNGSPVNATNNGTSDSSGVANLAANGAGEFVILWTNTDGSGKKFERFDMATGATVGSQLAFIATGVKPAFSVGIDNSGDVVVLSSSPPRVPGPSVYLQKFDASNSLVATWTVTDSGLNPSLSMDVSSGEFAVAWVDGSQDIEPGTANVYTETFSPSNVAGGVITVWSEDAPDGGAVGGTTVAMNESGNFVVAWVDQDPSITLTIREQQFLSDGSFSGSQVILTTAASGHSIGNASIAMNDSGQFAVTWSDRAPSDTYWSVWAEQYDPTTGLGTAFEVEPADTYNATFVDHHIAIDNSGQFLIVWSAPSPVSGYADFGRFYSWS